MKADDWYTDPAVVEAAFAEDGVAAVRLARYDDGTAKVRVEMPLADYEAIRRLAADATERLQQTGRLGPEGSARQTTYSEQWMLASTFLIDDEHPNPTDVDALGLLDEYTVRAEPKGDRVSLTLIPKRPVVDGQRRAEAGRRAGHGALR